MLEDALKTAVPIDDEAIPFAEAAYIDGQLMEVPPGNVMVASVEMEVEDYSNPVAVAAHVTSPQTTGRSSVCGCVSNNSNSMRTHTTHFLRPEDDAVSISFTTVQEEDMIQRQVRALEDESNRSSIRSQHNDDIDEDDSQVFGAGAAGAVLGLLMGGPIFSVILGLGALYFSQQDGATGDVARAMGDLAVYTRSRFLELNEKHHLVDKGTGAACQAMSKLNEIKQRHHQQRRCDALSKNAKLWKCVAYCWKSLAEFENKHHLLGQLSCKAKEQLDSLVEQYLPVSGHHGSLDRATNPTPTTTMEQ